MSRRSTNAIIELPDPVPQDPELLDRELTGKKRFESIFAYQLDAFPTLEYVRQLQFAKSIKRRWQFDFAFPKYRIAVEIDGVVVRRIAGIMVTMGGHADVQSLRKNHEKLNTAVMYGWRVLHFLQTDVRSRLAINTTLRVLAHHGWRA